ncbi:MAG: 5-formyltetrahydrofolate cyclo-ligase [Bacteroidales bacterium]|nr:5-formyltetrahydrofolate cyclo-ligase [Candidatus Colimorpha onthohippi]
MLDKVTLRKQIRAAKAAVPFCTKKALSATIMDQVAALPQFVAAQTVLMYWSMDDEVQTHDFVDCWYRDKTILLPCVDGDNLLLRQYTGRDCLREGDQFGIGEPTGAIFDNLQAIDIIIVPGVAFDTSGNRMGRGRGFYDRLLSTTPNAYKVGVAFGFQMVPQVPTEPHDLPMDKVIFSHCI